MGAKKFLSGMNKTLLCDQSQDLQRKALVHQYLKRYSRVIKLRLCLQGSGFSDSISFQSDRLQGNVKVD